MFGASVHRFSLDAARPADDADLPADYRWFIENVAASGAGPGYGLLPAHGPAQSSLCDGVFDGTSPRGVVALAHHGCGAMTLLACTGAHRGEVWVDTDAGLEKVAGSFREYFEAWLYAAIRRGATRQVNDPKLCALPRALSSYLNAWEAEHPGEDAASAIAALADGSIATASGGNDYFDAGDTLDLCIGCVRLGASLGLESRHLARGVVPKQGRSHEQGGDE